MTELWTSNHDAESHRCRIVLAEKDLSIERGIGVRLKQIDINAGSEDLALINPRNKVPLLVERNLKLNEAHIICEYLDERYPHPQLMPPGVGDRARARLLIHDFDSELYALAHVILKTKPSKKLDQSRRQLADRLLLLSLKIGRSKFFLGNELSMVDITLAPLLWRLESLKIQLPPKAAPLLKYAEGVFNRKSFIRSLTATEKKMRR